MHGPNRRLHNPRLERPTAQEQDKEIKSDRNIVRSAQPWYARGDNVANEAWRSGNERHAQDMFASYRKSAGYYPFGADNHEPVMNS